MSSKGGDALPAAFLSVVNSPEAAFPALINGGVAERVSVCARVSLDNSTVMECVVSIRIQFRARPVHDEAPSRGAAIDPSEERDSPRL